MEVRLGAAFSRWLNALRDDRARIRIIARLRRFELGNLGDTKPVGQGIFEARIDYGPGYRLYFVNRSGIIMILLCGGTKQTQSADISMAKRLAEDVDNGN